MCFSSSKHSTTTTFFIGGKLFTRWAFWFDLGLWGKLWISHKLCILSAWTLKRVTVFSTTFIYGTNRSISRCFEHCFGFEVTKKWQKSGLFDSLSGVQLIPMLLLRRECCCHCHYHQWQQRRGIKWIDPSTRTPPPLTTICLWFNIIELVLKHFFTVRIVWRSRTRAVSNNCVFFYQLSCRIFGEMWGLPRRLTPKTVFIFFKGQILVTEWCPILSNTRQSGGCNLWNRATKPKLLSFEENSNAVLRNEKS